MSPNTIFKKEFKITSKMKNKKILIICASGIGNTILFTPTLNAIRENFPKSKITLFVTKSVFAEPIKGSGMVDEIVTLKGNFWEKLKIVANLRKGKFDCSITAFPSNRWQFNVFAFLIGAKKRITHSYKVGKLRTFAFLQNIKILADETLHDVEQNLNLLKALDINPKKEKISLLFHINEENKKIADEWMKKNKIEKSDFLVGIHPGAGGPNKSWQGFSKRLPLEKWPEIIKSLVRKIKNKNKKLKIIIFGGPEEKVSKEKTKKMLLKCFKDVFVFEGDLKNTAALISKCKMFVSNDSGLMQTAVAVKVPKVIGIFGPTNPTRTRPYGKEHDIIKTNLPCSPCLKYPFYSTSSKIKCRKNSECLRGIKVEDMVNKIN